MASLSGFSIGGQNALTVTAEEEAADKTGLNAFGSLRVFDFMSSNLKYQKGRKI